MPISRAFQQNSPMVCSLDPSIMIVGGTPSLWAKRDNPSWASDLLRIGYTQTQPNLDANTCAYRFLQNQDITFDSRVSVNKSCASHRYCNCWSLVRKCTDSVGCKIVCIPFCVVASMVRCAAARPMFHRLARVLGPTANHFLEVSTDQIDMRVVPLSISPNNWSGTSFWG